MFVQLLDLAITNFGIQELSLFNDAEREVFPGCPEVHDGCMWANNEPGWGIDIDEEKAAQYAYTGDKYNDTWQRIRRIDGTVVRP